MEQLRIDLVPMGVTPNAHASQFDVGRVIRFLLYNGGTAYTLAGTETITVKMAKPDGTEETVSVTNTSSNYVDFITTDGLLNQVGLYPCEISITSGTDVIGSKNFNLRVELDPYDGHNIRTVTVGPADICTFETILPEPYHSVTVNVVATGGNGTPDNPNPIVGYSSANITRCGVNVWGGETMADSFVNAADYSKDTSTKTFTFSADKIAPYDETLIKGCFKENTQYTIILRYTAVATNNSVRVLYSDGTRTALNLSATNDKTDFVLTTTSDKTVSEIILKYYSDGLTTVYYDESGLFEGVKTVADFTPYNGQTYTIAFGQTVYGGVLDVTRGKLKPCIEYPSYNGETLSGRWLSSEATYVEGTTPPIGSQVVSLDDYGTDIDLTPVQIRALVGENNVFADCGETEVEYLAEE